VGEGGWGVVRVGGQGAEVERGMWPRERVWEGRRGTTGAHALHCEDVPTLAGLPCPDSSDLDQKDAPAFTVALMQQLVARGWREDPAR